MFNQSFYAFRQALIPSSRTALLATCLGFVLLSQPAVAAVAPSSKPLTVEQQTQAFQKGLQAAQQDKLNQAYEIWHKLSQNPSNPPQLQRALENNLAVILMRQKKYDEAQKRLDAALQADYQVAKTLDNLNQIYAYQAQKAYSRVFEKTKLNEPKGDWLSLNQADLEAMQLAMAPVEPAPAAIATPAPVSKVEPPKAEIRPPQAVETKPEPKPAKEVVVKPAAKPVPAKPALSGSAFEVIGLVESWRQAWSGQDVDRYLSFYDARRFSPKDGMSYTAWEKSRYRSLKNPGYIKLYLDDVRASQVTESRVRVEFTQRYESDRFKDTIRKALVWQKDQNDWKIVQEDVIYADQN